MGQFWVAFLNNDDYSIKGLSKENIKSSFCKNSFNPSFHKCSLFPFLLSALKQFKAISFQPETEKQTRKENSSKVLKTGKTAFPVLIINSQINLGLKFINRIALEVLGKQTNTQTFELIYCII
jgi:hypothetical protein